MNKKLQEEKPKRAVFIDTDVKLLTVSSKEVAIILNNKKTDGATSALKLDVRDNY